MVKAFSGEQLQTISDLLSVKRPGPSLPIGASQHSGPDDGEFEEYIENILDSSDAKKEKQIDCSQASNDTDIVDGFDMHTYQGEKRAFVPHGFGSAYRLQSKARESGVWVNGIYSEKLTSLKENQIRNGVLPFDETFWAAFDLVSLPELKKNKLCNMLQEELGKRLVASPNESHDTVAQEFLNQVIRDWVYGVGIGKYLTEAYIDEKPIVPRKTEPSEKGRHLKVFFAVVLFLGIVSTCFFFRPPSDSGLNDIVSLQFTGDLSGEFQDCDFSLNILKNEEFDVDAVISLANKGNAYAQGILGALYYRGSGVEKDFAEAAKWFQLGAEQGDAQSETGLGVLYFFGNGVDRSYRTAVTWFTAAAEQGNDFAQCALGYMNESATGMKNQDDETAAKWYAMAADQGNIFAQYHLGILYAMGRGVDRNYQTAVELFNKVAEYGHAGAQNNLANMYMEGRGVDQDFEAAATWYRKSAEQGNAVAQYNLGCLYRDGKGVAQNYEEAINWYTKSAMQGEMMAQIMLGDLFFEGERVAQDYEEAMKWYTMAAEEGDATAQNIVGYMYAEGLGVTQDYEEAVLWLRKAAFQENSNAQYSLGTLYRYGLGVEKNEETALHWFELAAAQGNEAAADEVNSLTS